MSDHRINCFRCEHFFVTWDADKPRGCRALGFKCREMPSQAVRGASGEPCFYFSRKRRNTSTRSSS